MTNNTSEVQFHHSNDNTFRFIFISYLLQNRIESFNLQNRIIKQHSRKLYCCLQQTSSTFAKNFDCCSETSCCKRRSSCTGLAFEFDVAKSIILSLCCRLKSCDIASLFNLRASDDNTRFSIYSKVNFFQISEQNKHPYLPVDFPMF